MNGIAESEVEAAAREWPGCPGWTVAERAGYGAVVLEQRPCDALVRLNPALPASALDGAFRKPVRPGLRSKPPMPFGIRSDLSWHRLPRGPQNPAFLPIFGTDCSQSSYPATFAFAMPSG